MCASRWRVYVVDRWVDRGTRLPPLGVLRRLNHACFPALASVTGELRDSRRGTSPAAARARVWKRKKKWTGGRIEEERTSRSLIASSAHSEIRKTAYTGWWLKVHCPPFAVFNPLSIDDSSRIVLYLAMT